MKNKLAHPLSQDKNSHKQVDKGLIDLVRSRSIGNKSWTDSPVKLWEDPGQIATQIIFTFLTSLDPYYKHTKSRIKWENMKFDFFAVFVLN